MAALPFELYTGVMLAGLTFTNLELLVLMVLALWAVGLAIERRLPRLPRSLVLGVPALLAIFCVSAALAPEWRMEALKFTARQAQGALLACCLADQITAAGWPLVRRLGLALILGAAASAALGLLEITEAPPALALLAIFKDQPTMAGGLLRLSATFGYANIAAMFYEAALPIALVGVALAASRPARRMVSGAALLLYGATLLTYSRAALLTATAAIVAIMLGAILARRRASAADRTSLDPFIVSIRRVVLLCLALLALAAGALLFSPTLRLRIAAPDVADWYRAEYAVGALPPMAPNALISTPVTIRNRGLLAWRSGGLRPVALSYHWLDRRTRQVVRYNGRRTPLPKPVEPGGALLVDATVQAPERPGEYILAWDMVVEHSGWFSERGSAPAEAVVLVAGLPIANQLPPVAEPASTPRQLSVRPAPPARSLLWSAALRMWRARPLLGIGPDVFRHAYGPELGLQQWDDRVHTNNLYLELLVGAGAAGLAAFLLLIGAALRPAIRVLASQLTPARGATWWMALGCAVALLTFLIHGLFDMFLEYSATYLLLWALIGALGSLSNFRGAEDQMAKGPNDERTK